MTTASRSASSNSLGHLIPNVDFEVVFPDDKAAEAWCSRRRWNVQPVCPFCDSANINTFPEHELPYMCMDRECGKRFSVKTGTIFEGMNSGCRELALAMFLMWEKPEGISPRQLADRMGISGKLAWHLIQRMIRRYQGRPILTYEWIEVIPEYASDSAKSGTKNRVRRRLGRAVVVDGMATDAVAAGIWNGLRKKGFVT